MRNNKFLELSVGVFMLLGVAGFFFLALKVSGLTHILQPKSYIVSAEFDNIGDLKIRSPVTIAGVRVGEVVAIELAPSTFQAKVVMRIDANQNRIPQEDAMARILTQGLLGSNYISLSPGFEAEGGETVYLQNQSRISKTEPALILENLIGQLLFKISKD